MKEIDVGYLVGGTDVTVRLSDRMYAVQPEPHANWVWHAFRGFERLEREGKRPRVFASIGSGSGVDAIGAARIFDSVQTIVVTDVEASIVEQAAHNVRNNVRSSIEVVGLCGDLCRPLESAGITADIVYANLPNLPLSSTEAIDHGTFYRAANGGSGVLDTYLLGLQYAFLESAKRVLSSDGDVAFMVGGRFPLGIFDVLQATAAFDLRELVVALKVQTEAECVTHEYAKHESSGTAFEFYDYERAEELLAGRSVGSGAELKKLVPAVTTAREAHALVRRGRRVGHTLHMLTGRHGSEAGSRRAVQDSNL